MSDPEPRVIKAGTYQSWTRRVEDYPPGDGNTLHYSLIGPQAAYSWQAVTDPDDATRFKVELTTATTAAWTPDRYEMSVWIETPAGERIHLEAMRMQVAPDPSVVTPRDTLGHARRMLTAIEATLEGRATADELDLVRSAIGDSSAERDTAGLIELRDKYKLEVQREEKAEAIGRGEGLPNSLAVRF